MALPRIDEVPSSVAFTAVARQLEATYSNVMAEGLPEPLAGLAERLSQEERPDAEGVRGALERKLDHAVELPGWDAGQEQGGEGSASSLVLAALLALGLGYGLAWMKDRLESR
jgi:hypothetical protein